MVRRSKPGDPEALRANLEQFFQGFTRTLEDDDLRTQVQALVPAYRALRDLGSSLIPVTDATSARSRILYYFRQYPRTALPSDELMVVAGIQEWARRVRELRVQFGWRIYSGVTAAENGGGRGRI